MIFAKPFAELVAQFEKLPGIGPKSAQRLAFHILKTTKDDVRGFSQALINAKELLKFCEVCQNISDTPRCFLCSNPKRDISKICVVSEPQDVAAIERSQAYNGQYHVLHGLLNPINGIGPDEIKMRELMTRINDETDELILATNPTIEGDTTALYISKLTKDLDVKTTRLAHGMPVGGELDYADTATLLSAIEFRREV